MFEAWNFGPTQRFPTCVGNIEIAAHSCVSLDSRQAAGELSEFRCVEIHEIKKSGKLKRPELFKLCGRHGIAFSVRDTNKELLSKLEIEGVL